MNRRYCYGLASVLYFLCFIAVCGNIAYTFEMANLTHSVKIISDVVMVISGYSASFFYCLTLTEKKAKNFMKTFLVILFGFYIITLVDFTLIDDNFGRNIFNFLSWNKSAFKDYLKSSTNLIPFATVKLFIKGYFDNNLTLWDTVLNLLGNFAAFMPLTLFVAMFFENCRTYFKVFLAVLLAVIGIELLQFIFLTGSTDIDDIILNTGGAMLFYWFIRQKKIGKGLSNLTFKVWENEN